MLTCCCSRVHSMPLLVHVKTACAAASGVLMHTQDTHIINSHSCVPSPPFPCSPLLPLPPANTHTPVPQPLASTHPNLTCKLQAKQPPQPNRHLEACRGRLASQDQHLCHMQLCLIRSQLQPARACAYLDASQQLPAHTACIHPLMQPPPRHQSRPAPSQHHHHH